MKADLSIASRKLVRISLLSVLLACSSAAVAQDGGWASESDPLAKQLIEQERQWATLACTPASDIVAKGSALLDSLIADDFVGTSPAGPLYTKSDMMTLPTNWEPEQNCKLISAKARFIGSDVAVIYGRESADLKGKDGSYSTRTLVWTDTFLKRGGKWQIIAVQDMTTPSE